MNRIMFFVKNLKKSVVSYKKSSQITECHFDMISPLPL